MLLVPLGTSQAQLSPPERRQFFDEIAERVAVIPGVQSSSFAMMPILGRGEWGSGLTLDSGAKDNRPGPQRNAIGARFFETLGTPIVAGREFSDVDAAATEKVAIVNESFARRYFDGRALGRRIGPGGPKGVADFTIVGIVRDSKAAFVRETSSPVWYVPYQQLSNVDGLVLHVRAAGSLDTVANDVREVVANIDRRVPILNMTSMDQQILAGGLTLALIGASGLRPLLFGIEPVDMTTIAVSAAAVSAVTLAAAWLPARHAVRLNPTSALQ